MTGSWRSVLAAGMLVLVFTATTSAFGRQQSWGSTYVPVVEYPYCPIYVPMIRPMVMPIPYASPRPAPPSGNAPAPRKKEPPVIKPVEKEPPLGKPQKAPTIIESRSSGGNYAGSSERCKVGFWNLTGRDVQLKINGETRLLAKDRALTLELDRAFVWQIDQQEPASERVPPNQTFFEVVLRK